MSTVRVAALWGFLLCLVTGTMLQNGQVRLESFPDTRVSRPWKHPVTNYSADAPEITYHGRWDSKHVSWWSTPGIRFGYTGRNVSVTFGNLTSHGVLVAYRIGGLDWMFTNLTAGGTHEFVHADTPGSNETAPLHPMTFELRVTNWAYGVQIEQVHVAEGEKLIRLPDLGRKIEIIGDSLAAGMYTTYGGLSGWGYGLAAGLGDTDYSITAQAGICATDHECWGNARGQAHQWFYTSDTSGRAVAMYGDKPEAWDFGKHRPADMVVICIGTNDQNSANNITAKAYRDGLTKIIQGVHGKWPKAKVVLMSLWIGWNQQGNTWASQWASGLVDDILEVSAYFNSAEYLHDPVVYDGLTTSTSKTGKKTDPFVHYFNTTGILQHNDNGPKWHPNDVGHVKMASHLQEFIRITFGWDLRATGPEVLHNTMYWNDENPY